MVALSVCVCPNKSNDVEHTNIQKLSKLYSYINELTSQILPNTIPYKSLLIKDAMSRIYIR